MMYDMKNNTDRENARKLLRSARVVQILGVTATGIAFVAFAADRGGYFKPTIGNMGKIFTFSWPLIVAYFLAILTLFSQFEDFISKNSKRTLWWIYLGFMFFDTILLGFLVWQTGGPGKSFVTPVFLLIPTVATCYCHPKRKYFWLLVVSVVLVFVLVSWFEFKVYVPPFVKDLPIAETYQMTKGGLLFVDIFTICCFLTAAYCYYETSKIRSDYCGLRKEGDGRPTICGTLYL